MKDNAKRVLIAVLCVCLAGALIWAIAGQIAQSRYKLRLKSMYERSYYSFVGSMDELEVNLSKLMVTGAPEQEVSRMLCEGDVLSVRGYGKYLVAQVLSETKKGRLHLLCKKYV